MILELVVWLMAMVSPPLPKAPRPPGTIGVVCTIESYPATAEHPFIMHEYHCSSDGLKGIVKIRDVDIAIRFLEKGE